MYSSQIRLAETLRKIKSRDRETGVSLVEILVYILLFSIIAVMTVAIISSTVGSSNRFTESSTTQTQVNQSASMLQRDISLANAITFASATRLEFRTRQDNADFNVQVFEYIPGSTSQYPTGTVVADLPPYNAIIQIRTNVATGESGQTVLVQGIQPSDAARELFRYFDSTNAEIIDTSTASSLTTIARVEFNIVANSTGRASNIELRSSATPSYTLPPGVQADNLLATVPDCPPNFNASIAPRQTQATVSWNAPSGATSYTVYRYNQSNSNVLERTEVFPNPDTTSWVDTGLQWGTTYRYAIQASGPGGTTAQCASSVATVVPDEIGFANINALQQSLTATKSGTGAETLTAPAVTGVTSATASTTNILPGARYTVARNLTNQLAWESTFGATRYNIYIQGNPTPVARISAGTLYWQHAGRNYGAVTNYIVRAENAGGESFASDTITLISPPAASTFSVATPDTSTRATTTDAVFTVTNRAANTVGYKAQRNSVLTANPDCNATSSYTDLNFSSNSVTDANALWGSASCYRFTPFNAAGDGPTSSGIEVDQLPGKFTARPIASTQYQWINEGVALPAEAHCWVDPTGNTTNPCYGGATHSSGNRLPIGLFSRLSNQKTNITVNWNESENAFGGYRVERTRLATAGTVDQAGSASGTAGYVNGVQSLRFNNEMPGSLYQFRIVARSANGLERNSTTAQHLTSPDIPSYAHNRYQYRSAYSNPTSYTRIDLTFNRSVNRGLVSSFIARTMTPGGSTNATYPAGSQLMVGSVPYAGGHNNRSVTSTLSYGGFYSVSATIGRVGWTNSNGCNPCDADWGNLPEYYPRYWAGTYARYNGGGTAAAGSVVQGNPATLPAPTEPVDPPTIGDTTGEGSTFNCSTTSEGSPDFTTEGCEPGTGIPITPSNLRVTSQDGTNAVIAWDAVANVQGYVLRVTNGGSTSNYTQVGTSRTIPAPAPGTNYTVQVLSYNLVQDSPISSAVTVTTGISAPANLRYVTGNASSGTFAWDAVAGANTYTVRVTQLGVTNTYNTTSLSRTISLGQGISTQVEVRANGASANSVYSAPLTHNIQAATPTGLSLVNETLILPSSWNEVVAWNDTPSAYNGYRLTAVVNGSVRTFNLPAGTTSYTVTGIPLGAGVNYSIVALAPGGNSPSSAVVSKTY